MEHEPQTSNLREFLTVIFKHKSKILIIFLATVITITVGTFLLPPVYEAKSSLMVKFGRENMYRPEVGDTKPSISFQSFKQEEIISSELQILKSRDLTINVINAIGMDSLYPDIVKAPPKKMTPLDAAALKFEKNLSVEHIKKSNVIEVSLQHKDPIVAARAVNRLVEFFKEKHLQVLSTQKSSFLQKQLNIYQQKLKESEDYLESYKQKHKIFSHNEQRSLLLQQSINLDTSLKTIQYRIQEIKQLLSSPESLTLMPSNNATFYAESKRYEVIDNAKAKLLSLQLREQELLGKYPETSRVIANIRKEIHLVETFLQEQEKSLAESELGSLEAKVATIKNQLEQLHKELRTLDLTKKELEILKRQMATSENNYNIYLSKLEEARISEDMDVQKMANISIIQKAFVPAVPIKPRKTLNIALGLILGAISGLGFAFFSEYLSEGLSTPESAEISLGLPVLTTIPYYNGVNKTGSTYLKWGFGTTAVCLLIAGVFWISQFKDSSLSRGEDMSHLQAVQIKPDVSEIQKEEPALDEELFAAKDLQTVSTEQEPVVSENDGSAQKINVNTNMDDLKSARDDFAENEELLINDSKQMIDTRSISVEVDVANIRKEPLVKSKRMGLTFKNEHFAVLNESMDNKNMKWYQIPYKGEKGWISGTLVEETIVKETVGKEQNVIAMKAAPEAEKPTVIVLASTNFNNELLQVETPDINDSIPSVLTKQKEPVVSENDGSAQKINVNTNMDDLKSARDDFAENEELQINDSKQMIDTRSISVEVDVANIRKEPSVKSKKMGLTFKNRHFVILNESMDNENIKWYQIPYKGEKGWISAMLVKETISKETGDDDQYITASKESSVAIIVTPVVPTKKNLPLQKMNKIPRWAINVSSTPEKDNAINLLDKVNKNGYNAYMTSFNRNNILWYRVRIGFFPTKNDARLIGQDIRKEYSIDDYWIVKASKGEILEHKRK